MQKAKSLTMAAVFTAALSAPAVAIAGPKFEELERAVPAELKDAAAIYDALLKALGTDVEAVKALQRECFGNKNPTLIKGALVKGGSTDACIRDHADAMARARAHAAEDRAAIEADLGKCTAGAGDCVKARDAAAAAAAAAAAERDKLKAERDALDLRLRSGGDLYGDSDLAPFADASAFGRQNCPPGFQARWVATDDGKSGTLTCSEPVWKFTAGLGALDPSGTAMTTPVDVGFPKGRYAPAPILVPPPPPEPKGTCDGAGGKLLCYVLPAAAAVVAGLIVADVASDDFDLITVER